MNPTTLDRFILRPTAEPHQCPLFLAGHSWHVTMTSNESATTAVVTDP